MVGLHVAVRIRTPRTGLTLRTTAALVEMDVLLQVGRFTSLFGTFVEDEIRMHGMAWSLAVKAYASLLPVAP